MAESSSSSAVGLGGWVFLIFLFLKLVGKIAWSWWWVTAPLWIPAIFVALIVGGMIAVAGLMAAFSK